MVGKISGTLRKFFAHQNMSRRYGYIFSGCGFPYFDEFPNMVNSLDLWSLKSTEIQTIPRKKTFTLAHF